MKKDTHPENRYVIFEDDSCETQFLMRSTVKTSETGKYKEDGKEYPLFHIEISSKSHPLFTGQEKVIRHSWTSRSFQEATSKLQRQRNNFFQISTHCVDIWFIILVC